MIKTPLQFVELHKQAWLSNNIHRLLFFLLFSVIFQKSKKSMTEMRETTEPTVQTLHFQR